MFHAFPILPSSEDIAQKKKYIKSSTWKKLAEETLTCLAFVPLDCVSIQGQVFSHGCRSELLQGGGSISGSWCGSDWGQTDQTRLDQRWGSTRSLRWSRWNESNPWGTERDFLWSAGRHWGGFCFGITSKVDYEEDDWIETYGAWPRDHAGHSSASHIAEGQNFGHLQKRSDSEIGLMKFGNFLPRCHILIYSCHTLGNPRAGGKFWPWSSRQAVFMDWSDGSLV